MNTTTYDADHSKPTNYAYTTSWKALTERFQDWKRSAELKLAGSGAGRIVLHLALAVMTCRFAWHFQGIARELTRG